MLLRNDVSMVSIPSRVSSGLLQIAMSHQILLGVLFLILCGWKFTFGLQHVLDLDASWHEARYLAWVTHHADGPAPPDYSPLYVAFLKLERWFAPDSVALYYLNDAVLSVLLPVAFFVFLAARAVPLVLALPCAGYLLISAANLPVAPKPIHLALTVILLSMALFVKLGERPLRWWLVMVTAGALTLIRPEFLLPLAALSLYVICRCLAGRRVNMPLLSALALSLPVIAALWWWGGVPLFNEKSMEAFARHFAINYVHWNRLNQDPVTADHLGIFHAVFGNAGSIPAAFLANPAAFLHHVAANLLHAPATLGEIFLGHYNVVLPRFKFFTLIEAILLAAALAIGLRMYWLRHRAAVRPQAVLRTGKLVTVFVCARSLGRDFPELVCLLCYLIPFPIMVAVLYPRYHYALALGLIPLAAAIAVLGSRLAKPVPGWRSLIVLPVLLLAVPSLGSAGAWLGAGFTDVSVAPRPGLETVQYLRTLRPQSAVSILEEAWLEPYLSSKFSGVGGEEKNANFLSFIADRSISVIIANDRLRGDPRYRDDPEWVKFERTPGLFGFAAHVLEPSGVVIYAKTELMPERAK